MASYADLHHNDGSHRRVPPTSGISEEDWAAQVQAHIDEAAEAGGCRMIRTQKRHASVETIRDEGR